MYEIDRYDYDDEQSYLKALTIQSYKQSEEIPRKTTPINEILRQVAQDRYICIWEHSVKFAKWAENKYIVDDLNYNSLEIKEFCKVYCEEYGCVFEEYIPANYTNVLTAICKKLGYRDCYEVANSEKAVYRLVCDTIGNYGWYNDFNKPRRITQIKDLDIEPIDKSL